MFELAAPVLDRLSQGRPVRLARVIDSHGFSSRDPAAAVALDERGPFAGQLLGGAADRQLVELAGQRDDHASQARIVEISVSDPEALGAGLSCGGAVRLLVQDAREFGGEFWQRLADGQSAVIVTELDSIPREAGPVAQRTVVGSPGAPGAGLADAIEGALLADVVRLLARGSSVTSVVEHGTATAVVTALWPTPSLVVVGDGLIAEALVATSTLLGWNARILSEGTVVDEIDQLATGDAVVVLSHDLPLAGPALQAALQGSASYVGALGSRRTQSKRRDWLAAQGVPAEMIERIHGPAGLDLGALTPAEIALSIAAEVLAVRTGTSGRPLREGSAPIHHNGLNTAPPRH